MSSIPKTPKISPDSGSSHAFGYVTEVIGAGEIEGVINDKAGVFLNDTPVQLVNPVTGEVVDNFKGGTFEYRKGTPNQPPIALFGDRITSEIAVGVNLEQTTPIARTINNPDCDAIGIRVAIQLTRQDSKGNVKGSNIAFQVWIKEGNGNFELRYTSELGGKFSTPTEFEFAFPINNQGGTVSNFAVRLQRLTPDSTDPNLVRTLAWQSYSEIISTGITYKNTAYAALSFDAEQYSSIPTRKYLVAGLLFNIPTNCGITPARGLAYSGNWNGNFTRSTGAAADPVWFLYWLLLDKVNGLGEYIKEADIDKWSFYDASVYNNQLVSDGMGGQEPRFLFNGAIANTANAWEVLDQICSSFFARRYWSEGTVKIAQDRPGLVQMQFTNADVENGQFTYSSTAIDERVNSVRVTWYDPNNLYQEAIEEVEDRGLVEINGLVADEVVAVGCTSRGQAIRYGRKIIYSSNLETETVSFTSRAVGEYARIGDLVAIADNNRSKITYAGLVAGVIPSTSSVRFDSPTIISSSNAKISILMPDGSISTHTITSGVGVHDYVDISPIFNSIFPNTGANFVITEQTKKTPIYRVLSKKIVDDNTSAIEITALLYDESKYAKIENGWLTEPTPLAPSLQAIAITPAAISTKTASNVDATINVTAYWNPPLLANGQPNADVTQYLVSYRQKLTDGALDDWSAEVSVSSREYTVNNLESAIYQFRLRGVTSNGTIGDYVQADSQLIYPFTDVVNFSASRYSGFVTEV